MKPLNFVSATIASLLLMGSTTSVANNTWIETMSLGLNYKTGERQTPQHFEVHTMATIVRVFDPVGTPPVWGSVSVKPGGRNHAIITIHADGYPGRTAYSNVSFKAELQR